MREPEGDPTYEGRLFSAIAFSHPSIARAAVLKQLLSSEGVTSRARNIGDWTSHRIEVVDTSYRYRSTRVDRSVQSRDGGYAYPIFFAVRERGNRDTTAPVIFLAAPFVLLIGRLMARVRADFYRPRVTYFATDLDRLFAHLIRERSDLHATQVTLQPDGVPGVSLVALTGSSPLISRLRRDVGDKAVPYSARVEVPRQPRDLRLYLNRRGKFWWHQESASDFDTALTGLTYLIDHKLVGTSHDDPLQRVAAEPVKTTRRGRA